LNADALRTRAVVLRALRRWFDAHGYLEVPTPVLVPSPALEEHLHPVRADGGFLRTSPEFALKKALASGLGRVVEIGPCFRDRESGPWHAREFTMCEWYRVGAGLAEGMDEVEELIGVAADALGIPRPTAIPRRTVREAFAAITGVDLAHASAEEISGRDEPWDDAFFRRWVTDVEPKLGTTFLFAWPASQAALARVRSDGAWPVAERFEVYVNGIELANAFLELTDPAELLHRFATSNAARVAANEEPHPIDHELIAAVVRIPRTTGVAMGVDRLVAALSGWRGITAGRDG
jgi:lysyl-tRNA synthetase class 2